MNQPVRMCPLLTIATLKPPEPKRVLAIADKAPQQEQGFDAVPCAGPNCAWWQPINDEKGRQVGGNCAMTLLPMAIGMVNGTIREAAAISNTDKKGN